MIAHVERWLPVGQARRGGAGLRRLPLPELDVWLLLVTLALCGLGLIMVYSASQALAYTDYGNPAYFFERQLLWLALGLVAMAGILGQHLITLSRRWISVLAFMTTGTCLVLMGVFPPVFQDLGISGWLVPAVVFLALVFGCALGAILIPAFTVLQEGTTEESRGRIFGGVFTVINASIALPLLAFGGAVDLFHSVIGVVDVFGALVITVGLSFRLIFWSRLAVLDHPAPADATSPGATSSR